MPVLNTLAQVLLAPLSDAWFSRLQYLRSQGRLPDLKSPATFNEQIQWLKVHHRDPLLRVCADKFTVREFVRERVGADHLIPLIGVYDHFENIGFDSLPDRFVLKASHGSGWNILCRDKGTFDMADARKKFGRWMKTNFYRVGREWAYDGLTPRIVCEEFLSSPEGEPPWDYKFFCFRGVPRYVQVDYGRFTSHTRAIYDTNWKRVPCQLEYAFEPNDSPRPAALDLMLEVAAKLSVSFPFVRTDLYELNGRVYFGELTFYPGKGVERFTPGEYDREFGKWLGQGDEFHRKPSQPVPEAM